MQNILIIGSSGFLGYHLIETLLGLGCNVDAVSRSRPKDDRLKIFQNYYKWNNQFYVDLTKEHLIKGWFKKRYYDVIIHLAGSAAGNQSKSEVTLNNVYGLHNLLEHASFDHLVFASTISLYGNGHLMLTEEDPVNPKSIYGWSKSAGEQLIGLFQSYQKFTSTILRIGTIVGDRMTHGVIFDFLRKLREDPVLEVWGTKPGSKKPFTHVDDIVTAIILAAFNKLEGTFNCCNNDYISIEEILEIMRPNKEVVWTGSSYQGDSKIINVNNSKLIKAGWDIIYPSSESAIRRTLGDVGYF